MLYNFIFYDRNATLWLPSGCIDSELQIWSCKSQLYVIYHKYTTFIIAAIVYMTTLLHVIFLYTLQANYDRKRLAAKIIIERLDFKTKKLALFMSCEHFLYLSFGFKHIESCSVYCKKIWSIIINKRYFLFHLSSIFESILPTPVVPKSILYFRYVCLVYFFFLNSNFKGFYILK